MIQFEQYNSEDMRHQAAIARFGAWSVLSASMLPLSQQRIANFPLSILGFSVDEDVPLTHAAITRVNEGVAMIGGYVTNPDFRGIGLGLTALQELVTVAPRQLDIHTFQAYVNEAGLSQFRALGGQVVGRRPPPVFTECWHIVEFSASN